MISFYQPQSQFLIPQQAPTPILKKCFSVILCCSLFTVFCPLSYAEQKDWNAQGDGSTWTEDANWYPSGAPDESDDAKVDLRDAEVGISQNFSLKSLVVGGKRSSQVSVTNFSVGNIEPESSEDNALLNRKDGKVILRGSSGKLTLKGAYKDSEEVIPEEPSFLLYVS
jgi:hypothetical protein